MHPSSNSDHLVFGASEAKHSMSSLWPLIGLYILDFSSEWNLTKLNRRQKHNVLYQVCVFWGPFGNQDGRPAPDWLKHFGFFLRDRWTEFYETWPEARTPRRLPSLWFFFQFISICSIPDWGTQVHDMWPFGPLVCLFVVVVVLFFWKICCFRPAMHVHDRTKIGHRGTTHVLKNILRAKKKIKKNVQFSYCVLLRDKVMYYIRIFNPTPPNTCLVVVEDRNEVP